MACEVIGVHVCGSSNDRRAVSRWPGRCAATARPAALCVGQHYPLRAFVRSPGLKPMTACTQPALADRTLIAHAFARTQLTHGTLPSAESGGRSRLVAALITAFVATATTTAAVATTAAARGPCARLYSTVCAGFVPFCAARANRSMSENRVDFHGNWRECGPICEIFVGAARHLTAAPRRRRKK